MQGGLITPSGTFLFDGPSRKIQVILSRESHGETLVGSFPKVTREHEKTGLLDGWFLTETIRVSQGERGSGHCLSTTLPPRRFSEVSELELSPGGDVEKYSPRKEG